MIRVATPAACLLLGCARVGSTEGLLGGEEPGPWKSGFWYATDHGYPDMSFVVATMRSYRNACDREKELYQKSIDAARGYAQDELDRAGVADALDEAERDALPASYWSLSAQFTLDDAELVGSYACGPDFSLHVFEVLDHTDWQYELGLSTEEPEDMPCWGSTEGQVEVSEYATQGVLSAEGSVTMADCYDLEAAGSFDFTMTVEHCPGLEALQEEWDELRDSLPQ